MEICGECNVFNKHGVKLDSFLAKVWLLGTVSLGSNLYIDNIIDLEKCVLYIYEI